MTSNNFNIQYYKWNLKDFKKLNHDILTNLNIKDIQSYNPIMALYFYYHNTPKSHNIIDFKRRFYIQNILNIDSTTIQYSSNKFLEAKIFDSNTNNTEDKEVFLKILPLLDPITYIMNNYNIYPYRNPYLPSNYNHNTYSKINSMENNSYIDSFMSYIGDYIQENKILPCFAKYYGGFNGIIKNYSHDITEEFHSFRNEKWFKSSFGKIFSIDVYDSDSDSDSDSYSESESGQDSHNDISHKLDNEVLSVPINPIGKAIGLMDKFVNIESPLTNENLERFNETNDDSQLETGDVSSDNRSDNSNSTNSSYYSNKDYIINIKDFPVQLIFMEKLDETLEDLLQEDKYDEKIIKSILFQTIFALAYLQKHFDFTHNDLHINNVMYINTEQKYLYYKYNNQYYQIPTYGKIAKLIDFGRAIFTIKNKVFFNDVFSKYGEAEGQYTHPISSIHYNVEKKKSKNKIKPNYSFDLCRLATTMIDFINTQDNHLLDFLNRISTDCDGVNLNDNEDSFDLYVKIAEKANKGIPKDLIGNKYFREWRIKKKNIFKKSKIYSM
tara:strand:- start:340 stop:1998 length:1659 start_codon:yes stop_codon:yes gene_type:complete